MIRLNRRLFFAGLIFLFMFLTIYFVGGLAYFGSALPRVLPPVENGILWILLFSVITAFIDVVFVFVMLIFIEFLVVMGVAYLLSLTRLFSFWSVWHYAGTTQGGEILSLIFFVFTLMAYFHLWEFIPHRSRRYENQTYEDYTDEDRKKDTKTEAPAHTKEELVRLLNLWQQKFAQATTDEDKKEANEMIMKYTDELGKFKAQEGEPVDKGKRLTGGGGKE